MSSWYESEKLKNNNSDTNSGFSSFQAKKTTSQNFKTKDMIIFSLGVNRLNDGLTLCIHDEIRYNDDKLSEARKHRDEITKSLSVFDSSRNSLYLSNSKYSIHWITSTQIQYDNNTNFSNQYSSSYADKPHAYTTPSKAHHQDPYNSQPTQTKTLGPRSSYVVIAIGQHVKKNNCEQSIFKALDKIDKDFDIKYSSLKVHNAKNQYQYSDFNNSLNKVKNRFQNSHSKIRSLDKNFTSSLSTSPIVDVREDFVIRWTRYKKNRKKSESDPYDPMSTSTDRLRYKSNHSLTVGSSKEHNLKTVASTSNLTYYWNRRLKLL